MSEGWDITKAVQASTRIEGKQEFTRHALRFRRPGTDLVVGDVFPEIVLVNSHDRGSAYQMHAGLFRLACLNGLVVDDATFGRLSIRHQGKGIIDDVRRGADEIVASLPGIQGEVRQMQEIELSPDERGVFAAVAMSLKYDEETIQHTTLEPRQLLARRRYGDEAPDVWTTYNTIQENLTRGGLQYTTPAHRDEEGQYVPTRRNRTRGINGIAEDIKLNKALYTLAAEMKKLKMAA